MHKLALYLYNTCTKKKDFFTPIDSCNVTMYVCGPTVYDRPHIGNVRSAVVYDILYRLLKFLYPKVTYIRNITDIDDKIIATSIKSKIDINILTEQMIEHYNEDVAAVHCLPPKLSPKATQHLAAIFNMIQRLIDNGHAYVAEGHVLFDVKSYSEYGHLSRRSTNEMMAGIRIEVAMFKKNPEDFVLWKPTPAHEMQYGFDSPWGRGRPGWHIECSAMSTAHLGIDFDIHGGGVDLVFPHHENEIAQAVCANKNSSFAKYWIHNGFLTVNGEKMSKSLNNFTLLRDLINNGISGTVMRYFYLTTHYRKPIDFNKNTIHSAHKSLDKLAEKIMPLITQHDNDLTACDDTIEDMLNSDLSIDLFPYIKTLCDDLNTPKFLTQLSDDISIQNLAMLCTLIGFKPSVLYKHLKSDINQSVIALAEQREMAKNAKNWPLADALRQKINTQGYQVMDQKGGGYKLSQL